MISCKVRFPLFPLDQLPANIVAADTDAEHIAKLTKQDLTSFYAHYISTTSTSRAKISVHLQAQSKPAAPTLTSQKDAAITTLGVLFTEHKITAASTDDVKARFENVADTADLPHALAKYLASLSLDKETEEKILDSAKAALGIADAGLPAEPKVEDEKGAKGAGQPVLIQDVYAWKAGMQVSSGVKPVRPLEEFVDIAERL